MKTSTVLPNLRPREVAQLAGLSLSTLARWRQRGEGPPFLRLTPGIVSYPRVELQMWLASRPRGGGRPALTIHHPAPAPKAAA